MFSNKKIDVDREMHFHLLCGVEGGGVVGEVIGGWEKRRPKMLEIG